MSTVDLFGAQWFKSSHSGSGDGSACVEIAWLKSSYSTGGNNAECVEVAFVTPSVAVRDSKSPEAGHLTVSPSAWAGFVARVR
ncbi:DUF397 domain-containing protein [Amycolatopsis sp. NPDC059021]|uniref:DUF397 domain-containing protein n=1 Tax=Amycolatopsis sp. NPDC059021 TaxID=3346704 RepID=UPI00367065A8